MSLAFARDKFEQKTGFLGSKKCTKCSSENRIYNSFCSNCGSQFLDSVTVWPQPGASQGRIGFSGQIRELSSMPLRWSESLISTATPAPIQQDSLPQPLIIDRQVIYYSPENKAFESRALTDGKRVWQAPIHRDGLTYQSSPIHAGEYIYFVTPEPNLIHRIHVDSGIRRVLPIKTPESTLFEVPGELFNYCGLLRYTRETDKRQQVVNALLLTSDGLLELDLSESSDQRNPEITGRFHPASFDSEDWNLPVVAGTTMLTTSTTSLNVLVVNLSALPGRFDRQIIDGSIFAGGDIASAPIVPSDSDSTGFAWMITDSDAKRTSLVRYRNKKDYRVQKVPFLDHLLVPRPGCPDLITDGRFLLTTGLDRNGESGLVVIYKNRFEFRASTEPFAISDCLVVARDAIFIARRANPVIVDPHSIKLEYDHKSPYSSRSDAVPMTSPILGQGSLIVQTNSHICSYEVLAKGE